MKTLRRFLVPYLALFAASLVFFSTVQLPLVEAAGGHVGVHNVAPALRTQTVTYHLAVPSATEVTEGTNGVISAITIWDGAAATSPTDSTMAVVPYPGKVDVVLIDGGAASGALTCTSVSLVGTNQFGEPVSETISTINETAKESVKVYANITSVSSAGCAIASGGDTSDILRVSISDEIGLPFRIKAATDIKAACSYDVSATDILCIAKADMAAAVDLTYESIEFDGVTGQPTLAQGDEVQIRVRAPSDGFSN